MHTDILKVTGMTCGGCTANVTQALKAVAGVQDVKVSLSAGEATVQFDERQASSDTLRTAVTRAGYGVGGSAAAAASRKSCCG